MDSQADSLACMMSSKTTNLILNEGMKSTMRNVAPLHEVMHNNDYEKDCASSLGHGGHKLLERKSTLIFSPKPALERYVGVGVGVGT